MRALLTTIGVIAFCANLFPVGVYAQQDRLEGRWEGSVQGPQGQAQAAAAFKKQADGYTGAITGRGNTDMPFKQIKLEGDRVLAQAEVEGPQGSIVIKYDFQLQGETLKGTGQVEFGGQTLTFNYDLKRTAATQAQAGGQAQTQPGGGQNPGQQRAQRGGVPQPQQKASIEYFIGQWNFRWTGRESALGPGGVIEGTRTFSALPDGKFLECRTEWKTDAGTFTDTGMVGFDEPRKILAVLERRSNGAELFGVGDWNSPIMIRFTTAPIKIKGQVLRLNRAISVISAHSFSITDELSEDGGPFVRLGNGVFSKVLSSETQK